MVTANISTETVTSEAAAAVNSNKSNNSDKQQFRNVADFLIKRIEKKTKTNAGWLSRGAKIYRERDKAKIK